MINGMALTAPAGLISTLGNQPGIENIRLDYELSPPDTYYGDVGPVEWNLDRIKAPQMWSLGYTGQGSVVAVMDSGVDRHHPDLANTYRGGTNSWLDPYGEHEFPTDLTGHGTNVTGIIVAGDASGAAIGVAPQSQWIAVKIFNDAGIAFSSAIQEGFQWLLDPDEDPNTDDAPDVVNNSWGL